MTAHLTKIGVVLQGPVQSNTNGYSTAGLLDEINRSQLRHRLHVVSVLWTDELPEHVAAVRERADDVVLATKPPIAGAGNRNLQRAAVTAALDRIDQIGGIRYVLKSRHDFLLSERVLREIVTRADAGFSRVFVTNLYTKWETFHISDMLLFSTTENVRAWYDPRDVYYQDLYSAEVQLARVFVRNRKLPYPCTQEAYLRFLRDWIEMIDWGESGIVWFRAPRLTRALVNRGVRLMWDRNCGPYMNRILPGNYPDRLRRHRRSVFIRARAVAHLLCDAFSSWAIVEFEAVAAGAGIRPRHWTVALPGGQRLEIHTGFVAKRYEYYSVDPVGGEETKPIGFELPPARRSEAAVTAVSASPEPPPVAGEPRTRSLRFGFVAFVLRRRASATSR